VPEEEPLRAKNLVLLTDTTQWKPPVLHRYKDSLQRAGYRVIISGTAGETAEELLARLPWLLQPGVDVFVYDERLVGSAGLDSLAAYLTRASHPATILALSEGR